MQAGYDNSPAPDHPRVRGEQGLQSWSRVWCVGPSPRARGAVRPRQNRNHVHGTIPACAGSSDVLHEDAILAGTIPACAGSSPPPSAGEAGLRDHPRVRGEQKSSPDRCADEAGPSPRARGADQPPADGPAGGGTIPACAGSRKTAPGFTKPTWDHPRVRGEQRRRSSRPTRRRGPSPRARGAEEPPVSTKSQEGTIPACAGSSDADRLIAAAHGTIPACAGSS